MRRFILAIALLMVITGGMVIGRDTLPRQAQAERALTPATQEDVADLRTQVADLTRRVETLERAPATAAPSPTDTPQLTDKPATGQSDGALTILEPMTFKDAGIGDGSFYAYVEVVNNSDRNFGYVGLDGVCRDAEDRVIATGMGNELNVAPGEHVVIDVIFLSAKGCKTVHVSFDGLTS